MMCDAVGLDERLYVCCLGAMRVTWRLLHCSQKDAGQRRFCVTTVRVRMLRARLVGRTSRTEAAAL